MVVDDRLVALVVQDVRDLLVYVPAVHARPDHAERHLLALQHRIVHALQLRTWLALDDRAGHVGEVAARLVEWEDVEDYGFAGPQGAVALLVRVGGLRPAGCYGAVGCGAPAPEEFDLYLCAQELAGQSLSAPAKVALPVHLRFLQDLDPVGAGGLERSLGLLDVRDLSLRLRAAEVGEKPAVRSDLYHAGADLVGVDDAQSEGYGDGARAELLEEVRGGGGVGSAAALQLVGETREIELVEGEQLVYARLLLGAAVLHRGDGEVPLTSRLDADHGVRRQEPREVVCRRVVLRGPDDEEGLPVVFVHAPP